jgi:hypothetical protein
MKNGGRGYWYCINSYVYFVSSLPCVTQTIAVYDDKADMPEVLNETTKLPIV